MNNDLMAFTKTMWWEHVMRNCYSTLPNFIYRWAAVALYTHKCTTVCLAAHAHPGHNNCIEQLLCLPNLLYSSFKHLCNTHTQMGKPQCKPQCKHGLLYLSGFFTKFAIPYSGLFSRRLYFANSQFNSCSRKVISRMEILNHALLPH